MVLTRRQLLGASSAGALGLLLAGCVILNVALQRYYVSGLASGSVKG